MVVADPSKQPKIMRTTLLKTAFLVGLAGSAGAQSNWTGTVDQDWNNAANWTAGVPGINSKANINVATGNFPQISTAVNKSATAGGNDLWVGTGAGQSGRLDINNAGSLDTSGTWMIIGDNGGTGTVNVNSGGSLVSNNLLRLGNGAGSSGFLNVAAGGVVNVAGASNLSATSKISVDGSGSLTTTAGDRDIQNLTATAFTGVISSGRDVEFDTLTSAISGGSVTAAGQIFVGRGETGVLNMTSGSASSGAWLVVGIGATGNGSFNLSGGTVTASTVGGAAFSTIGAGGGTGLVHQTGGTWIDNNKTVLGENAGGTGTFQLDGGLLRTGAVETGGGTGNLNLNGGTLRATRNSANFISANTTVNVQNGGARIDTDGFNVTAAANLVGTGSLEKQGAGTLTLSGNGNSVGQVLVSAGTLFVTGALTSTGTISVTGTGSIGAGDASSGITGNLAIAEGGTLDISLGLLTLGSGATLSFGGFDFDDIIGFDVDTAANGTYTLIEGDFTLNPANLAHFGAGNALDLGGGRSAFFKEGSLAVTVIPEPSAALLAGIGALGLLRRRRAVR
jgi:hypothetical protein